MGVLRVTIQLKKHFNHDEDLPPKKLTAEKAEKCRRARGENAKAFDRKERKERKNAKKDKLQGPTPSGLLCDLCNSSANSAVKNGCSRNEEALRTKQKTLTAENAENCRRDR